MFNFQLRLLVVGVFWIILGTDSYSFQPTYLPPPDPAYAYMPYSQPPISAYGKGFYSSSSSSSYGSPYSANCENMKVVSVLDQIFCQHRDRDMYSSTLYPAIETIIKQLKWAHQLVFIQDVYDFVLGAIDELKILQDAVNTNYGESNLLEAYDDTMSSGNQGYGDSSEPTDTYIHVSRKSNAADKMATLKEQLYNFTKESTTFIDKIGVTFQAPAQPQTQNTYNQRPTYSSPSSPSSYMTVPHTSPSSPGSKYQPDNGDNQYSSGYAPYGDNDKKMVIEVDLNQRAGASETEADTADKETTQRKRSAGPLSRITVENRSRKNRATQYTDFTCALLPPIHCSEDKYDELLFNLLSRVYTAADFIYKALAETDDFMNKLQCGNSEYDAFQESAISFGSMLTSFYSIIEVAEEVEKMYEIMVLDYGNDDSSSGYYRAGGGSDIEGNIYPDVSPPQASIPYVNSYPVVSPSQPSASYVSSYSVMPPPQTSNPYVSSLPGVSFPPQPVPSYVSQPPMSVLQTYPYSTYIPPTSYPMSEQYRYTRAHVTPAMPWMFVVQ